MQRPVMIFDGECGFCRRWIATWQRLTGDRVEYVAYQDLGDRFPELPREQFTRSVVLVEADGRVSHAAEAVCRSFAVGAGYRWLLWLYQRVPGIAPTMEAAYWFVAGHRQLFSALTPRDMPFAATRWWFLRLLGVVYLIAFVSLWTQVIGLIGERGILPASALMQQARQYFGGVNGWDFPTLCWFTASDAMLHGLCAAGVVLALLVIVDVVALPALWGLWALYLSLCTVGGVFMGYQWDSLLTEVGLLAALWASGSRTMLWLLRWLWFRLMFAAGVVKLSSGDALWRSLKTLTIHYETQPLPTWIGGRTSCRPGCRWFAARWCSWSSWRCRFSCSRRGGGGWPARGQRRR
jgi:predicted DCC family thiol-disulfide oxidoreductase YuxK